MSITTDFQNMLRDLHSREAFKFSVLHLPGGEVLVQHPYLKANAREAYWLCEYHGPGLHGGQADCLLHGLDEASLMQTEAPDLWNEEVHSPDEIEMLKNVRTLESHPEWGDYRNALAHFNAQGKCDAIYWHQRGASLRMDLDLDTYYQAALDLRGLAYWQLLFVNMSPEFGPESYTESFKETYYSKADWKSSYASLTQMLDDLEKMFPETNFAPYRDRLPIVIGYGQ